jgi:hypothetical protein
MKDDDMKEVVPVEFRLTFQLLIYRHQVNSCVSMFTFI